MSRRAFCIHLCLTSALLLTGVAGCAATNATVAGNEHHAACAVCEYNADLACIDIAVDDKTPRTEFAGQTRYFCSDECRRAFEKQPERYVRR